MAETNIKKQMRALMGPFQVLEDTIQASIVGLRVNDAVGAQLRILGKIVGEPYAGQDDDTYRRFVRARIATNNSDGLIEDHITVAKLVIGDDAMTVHVKHRGNGETEVELQDVVVGTALADIVHTFLQDAAGAGIRVVVGYWPAVESELFTFAAFPGDDQLGKGFGWTEDDDMGGVFAGAIG